MIYEHGEPGAVDFLNQQEELGRKTIAQATEKLLKLNRQSAAEDWTGTLSIHFDFANGICRGHRLEARGKDILTEAITR